MDKSTLRNLKDVYTFHNQLNGSALIYTIAK